MVDEETVDQFSHPFREELSRTAEGMIDYLTGRETNSTVLGEKIQGSLAMLNEQELPNLHSLLLKGEVSVVSNSNPRIAVVLDQMRDVYKFLSTDKGNGNRPLTRIHVHTLAYQAILTKKGSAWKNSGAAAVKVKNV